MCTNMNSTHCTTMLQTKTPTQERLSLSSCTHFSLENDFFQQDAFSLFIVNRPKPYQQLITAYQIHTLTAVT